MGFQALLKLRSVYICLQVYAKLPTYACQIQQGGKPESLLFPKRRILNGVVSDREKFADDWYDVQTSEEFVVPDISDCQFAD